MKEFIAGFTGTQRGMTSAQLEKVEAFLKERPPYFVIHGACIGADDEFDELAASLKIRRYAFPSDIKDKTVDPGILRSRTGSSIVIAKPAPPLKRNKLIVDASNLLIACPGQNFEILRSGTWTTIRRCRETRKQLVLIYP